MKQIQKSAAITTDGGAMTMTATISTPAEDRSGDVVHQVFDLTNYAKNPINYFDHGVDFTLPIGKSEDANGNLTVFPAESGTTAICFFSQSLPVAAQVFQLVHEKIIRATSINFIPVKYQIRPGTGSAERPGIEIFESEMLEWGPVGIPDNPEAVAKLLDLGRLDGKPIDAGLLRMLKSFAPQRKVYGKGIGKSDDSDDSIEDAFANPHRGDVLLDKHATNCKAMQRTIMADAKLCESPAVVKTLAAVHAALGTCGELMTATKSKCYPDAVKKDDDDGEGDSESKGTRGDPRDKDGDDDDSTEKAAKVVRLANQFSKAAENLRNAFPSSI